MRAGVRGRVEAKRLRNGLFVKWLLFAKEVLFIKRSGPPLLFQGVSTSKTRSKTLRRGCSHDGRRPIHFRLVIGLRSDRKRRKFQSGPISRRNLSPIYFEIAAKIIGGEEYAGNSSVQS